MAGGDGQVYDNWMIDRLKRMSDGIYDEWLFDRLKRINENECFDVWKEMNNEKDILSLIKVNLMDWLNMIGGVDALLETFYLVVNFHYFTVFNIS